MPRKLALIAFAASLGLARAASADPFLPVPPASFINYHVDTVHQLSAQIAYDAVVRGRLARHFHVAGPAMVTYVQKNLVLSYLKTAGTYRVACVTPSGHEYYVTQRLPKGTPVFALASTGKPILKRACGNPLVSSLPAAVPKHLKQTAQQAVKRSGQPALAEAPAAAPAPSDIVVASAAPGDTTLTAVPGLADGNVGDLGPFTRVSPSIASIGGGGGGFGLPLAGLAALGAAGLLGSHHGGSSNSNPAAPTPTPTPPITTPPVTPIPTPVSPAPEPNAMLVYGIGAMGLFALGYARRRGAARRS